MGTTSCPSARASQPRTPLGKRPVPPLAAVTHGTVYSAKQRGDLGMLVAAQKMAARPVFEGAFCGVVGYQVGRCIRRYGHTMEAAYEPQGHFHAEYTFALICTGGVFQNVTECALGRFKRVRSVDRRHRRRGESTQATPKSGGQRGAPLRERLRLQVREHVFRIPQPLVAPVLRKRPQHALRRSRPFPSAPRLHGRPAKQRFEPRSGLYELRFQLVVLVTEQHFAHETDREQIVRMPGCNSAGQQRAETASGFFEPACDRFREWRRERREPFRRTGLHAPADDGRGIEGPMGKFKMMIEHMGPGGVGVEHARLQSAPARPGSEQRLGHPRFRGQARVDRRNAVGIAHRLPQFGVEQPAPCEAGPDVEAESLVGERREHDEPIIFIDVGQPLAHCECRIAPAHGERLAVDGDLVRALPTWRMDSDDPSVRPELAQALYLPDQVLGGHGCRVRSSPSE